MGLGAAGALFAYLVARAWALSFTYDESYTYTRLVGRPLDMLLTYDLPSANHHLVNTLTMKAVDASVTASEPALRAGSLAAAAVFLAAIVVWAAGLHTPLLRALGFVLGAGSPFVLDYLVLARGYALALACVAVAALFAVRYARRPTLRRAVIAAAAGGGAGIAHFAFLPFFIGLCVAVAVYAFLWRSRPKATLLALGVVGALVTAVVVVPLARLRDEGLLYFGTGSPRDSFRSLVEGTLYGEWPSATTSVAQLVLLALLAFALVVTVRGALPSHPPPPSTMLAALVLLPVAVVIVQHVVFDTPYPLGRTALYAAPLAAMWVCTSADELFRGAGAAGRRAVRVGAGALLAAAVLNLAASLNLAHTYDWRYDADTESVAHALEDAVAGRPGARVGATWLLEPTLNFYRLTQGVAIPEITDDCRDDCLLESYDWYVTVPDASGLAPGEIGGIAVESYPTSGAVLLRTGEAAP